MFPKSKKNYDDIRFKTGFTINYNEPIPIQIDVNFNFKVILLKSDIIDIARILD